MLLSYLLQSPITFFIWLLAIVYALTVHEASHALGGLVMGDDTAKHEGRLTFNPLAHIDILGMLMLILVGFGWGKPVPFNPFNLGNKKWGPAIVAMFGPLANLASVIIFAAAVKILLGLEWGAENMLMQFLFALIMVNTVLLVFNLIPVPPLDGSKIFLAALPASLNNFKINFERQGTWLLIGLILTDRLLPFSILSALFSLVLGGVARLLS